MKNEKDNKSKKENIIKSKINKKKSTDKVLKIKTPFESGNFIQTKKLRIILIVLVLIFLLLIGRIGFLQFVQGSQLKEAAYNQQAINQIISPKRGNIYDSTGKALAISAQVDTITINPAKIVGDNDEETKELKKKWQKHFQIFFH